MKRKFMSALSIFAVAILLSSVALQPSANAANLDHGFSVKEYEEFHAVLHPLEHEALPKKDFKTIRGRAGELVKLGEAIVKLGVPRGVAEKHVTEFNEWLKKFGDALTKFKADAENATDEQLKDSYSAVHDSFEMLASMLPRK
jgi:hypothetical protein